MATLCLQVNATVIPLAEGPFPVLRVLQHWSLPCPLLLPVSLFLFTLRPFLAFPEFLLQATLPFLKCRS